MMTELPSIAQAYKILAQGEKHQELSKLSQVHNDSLTFGANAAFNYWFHPPTKGYIGASQSDSSIGRNLIGNKRPYGEHCKVP